MMTRHPDFRRWMDRWGWLLLLLFASACAPGAGGTPTNLPTLARPSAVPPTAALPTASPTALPATPTRAVVFPVTSPVTIITAVPGGTVAPITTPVAQTPGATAASPSPLPVLPSGLGPTTARFQLIDRFTPIFFCDPDLYPVARELDDAEVQRRVAAIQSNPEEYGAILKYLKLEGTTAPTPPQRKAIYKEHKRLESIRLQPAGPEYAFTLRSGEGRTGLSIEGTIGGTGAIKITRQDSAALTCPICLAADTLIDTPFGPARVAELAPGTSVWTSDRSGARRVGVVLQVIARPGPAQALLVSLVLADGRTLLVSAGHPTADGRVVGELRVGDLLDGTAIVRLDLVPYGGPTYDLLPSGETGSYWANGISMGSTLAPVPGSPSVEAPE